MIRLLLKPASLILLIGGIVLASCTQSTQNGNNYAEDEVKEEAAEEKTEEKKEAPASPRAQVENESNGVSITVDWGSPAVKGRTIWGDLVPYGEVWRAGANETTNVTFSQDVVINETTVAAGTYGLFIIPVKDADWTVVLNTSYDRDEHGIWGSMGYSEENDILRVDVSPSWADESEERLKFDIGESSIDFAWEKARLSIPYAKAE